MYQVYAGNVLIHDDRLESLKILKTKLSLEVGKSGLFEFVIYPNNPHYDEVKPVKSIIQVLRNGKNIFSGRSLSIKYGFHNEKQVTCEGELAFLLDSMIEPHSYSQNFAGYFPYILNKHNAQVETHKQFLPGNVTVADYTPFYVVENLSYYSTLDTLSKRLVEPSGGYLSVRREGGKRYLDLLSISADDSNTSAQTIKLGKNLIDLNRDINGADVFTAIIPLGAKQEGSEIRVDIKSVNNGLAYIVNEEARAEYGLIFRQVIFDNITYPQTLLEAAQKYLNEQFAAISSIEITAADLSSIDETLDSFSVGQWVKVESPMHGISDQKFLIKKMTINLSNPADTKIEIGRTKQGITDTIGNIEKSVSSISAPEAVQPYVIESGTSGIFTWKKFSDGTCEFFGKISVSQADVNIALGNWFRGDNLFEATAHEYPFQMAEAPALSVTFQTRNGQGALAWIFSSTAENAQRYLPQLYLIRPTAATGINGNINIIGKGKL
ncbi:MAG: phage tail spike protein [Acutalibacteraceae bacterium]